MRCTECDGTGYFATRNWDGRFGPLYPARLPCPDCGGTGITHCCDGMTAANETTEGDEDG